MYKLIIVDDEKSISSGMKKLPWEDWGFTVSGTAGDGLEALELIAEDKPDVVLSDVRMPNMDGVELMQYLNKNYPEIKIVILSGYSDFEYLNYSIKNKVIEYLLKPTDIDEFETLFRRIKEQLDTERKKDSDYAKSRGYYIDSLLFNMTLGGSSPENPPLPEDTGVDPDNCYTVLLYMEWQKEFRDELYLTKIRRTLIDTANSLPKKCDSRFFPGHEGKMIGIISRDGGIDTDSLTEYLNGVLDELAKIAGFAVYACISSHCTDRRLLPQCVQQSIITAHRHTFNLSERISFYSPAKTDSSEITNLKFNYDLLMSSIISGKKEQCIAEIKRVFDGLASAPENAYTYIENMCLELLFYISRRCLEYNISFEEVMEEQGFGYNDLRRMVGLDALMNMITASLDALSDCFDALFHADEKGGIAYKIKEIVDNEYLNNYISLEYISGKVGTSKAYVSRMFKEEFGCKFSEYITDKRLEKSKELLRDKDIKIYEIANMTGYADP